MQDLSPVRLFVMIAASVFGAGRADIIGPYVVIAIGAVGGAAVMIMQRERGDGNVRAFVYFWASVFLALFLTVPVAVLAAKAYAPLQEQWLFFPIAFGFGFLGDKWTTRIFPAIGRKAEALIDAWVPTRGDK